MSDAGLKAAAASHPRSRERPRIGGVRPRPYVWNWPDGGDSPSEAYQTPYTSPLSPNGCLFQDVIEFR
jgi:hypothetical protein